MAAKETVYRYRWVILVLSAVAQWSLALATQSLPPLAPLFQPELGLTKAEVGFFSSAAFTGTWIVLLVAGSLTDRFGVRTMMSAGQAVAGSFMLGMALVGSFWQAAVVMFAAGLGRGTVLPGSTKAIMDWFPPGSRATAMGLKQAGSPIGGIATAAVLPAVGLLMGWRFAMGLAGFVILVGGVAAATLYREAPRPGAAREGKPSAGSRLGQVIRNRYLWTMSGVAVLLVACHLATVTYLALYFKEIVLVQWVPEESTRIVVAGWYLALCQGGGVVGRVFWGAVSDRLFHGRRMVVLAIIAVLVSLLSVVMASLSPESPLWLLAFIVFAYGATAVGFNGLWHALMVEMSGRGVVGTGVGLSLTLGQIGTVAGPPLFGFVVDVAGSYRPAWLLLGALSATSALIAFATARGERHVA